MIKNSDFFLKESFTMMCISREENFKTRLKKQSKPFFFSFFMFSKNELISSSKCFLLSSMYFFNGITWATAIYNDSTKILNTLQKTFSLQKYSQIY